MSQADLNIDNQSRSTFRAEVNQSLQALATLSSGATAPTTTYAYQFWADTSSGLLKQRNAANNAWINKGSIADADWGFLPKSGGSLTGLLNLNDATPIASASTVDLTAADGNIAIITGVTTITALTMNSGQLMLLVAGGAFQLTYHATNLRLNTGGTNYICTAADLLLAYKASNGTVYVTIIKQDGTPVVGGVTNSISQLNSSVTVTDAGTGKAETTVDGTIIEELTLASRKSTIDGGTTLYPEFKCRAWVNFNGTGTPAIKASGNVTSITDNAVGDYTINLTTAMPDANYGVSGVCKPSGAGASASVALHHTTAKTSSACRVWISQSAATSWAAIDVDDVTVTIHR